MIIGIQENLNTLLLDLKTKMKKSKCQDCDYYTITLPLGQMGGPEVKSFNVLHGQYCHFDNDVHLSIHSKNT